MRQDRQDRPLSLQTLLSARTHPAYPPLPSRFLKKPQTSREAFSAAALQLRPERAACRPEPEYFSAEALRRTRRYSGEPQTQCCAPVAATQSIRKSARSVGTPGLHRPPPPIPPCRRRHHQTRRPPPTSSSVATAKTPAKQPAGQTGKTNPDKTGQLMAKAKRRIKSIRRRKVARLHASP